MSTPRNSTPNERTVPQPKTSQNEPAVPQQSMTQDEQRAMQEGTPNVTREVQQGGMKPIYPQWPTSKRGPTVTPPPPGQRSINAIRAEQMVEVGYNQATGEPATQDPRRAFPDESKGPAGTDQQETAQDVMRRGKERL